MKIATVRAGIVRTFNLGDYNSLKLETSIEADIEEGDDPKQIVQDLFLMARDEIRTEYMVQVAKKKPAESSKPAEK